MSTLTAPIVDGAKVISTARKDLGLTQLPIIAVSASGDSARKSALDGAPTSSSTSRCGCAR
jgi:CheY-like chemotaxis protein